MRIIALVILAACTHRAQPPVVTPLGESTAPGPREALAIVPTDAGEASSGAMSPHAFGNGAAPIPEPAPAPAVDAQPGVTSPPPNPPPP
jgi:hypothetical protein